MADQAYGPEGLPTPPKEDLESEGNSRLAACRVWKSLWDLDLRECYFFASPQRQRQIQSYNQPPQQRLLDAAELNTDFAMELCDDFATEVINTYLPEAIPWCERGPGERTTAETWKTVKDQVAASDEGVFKAIKASNFYAELSKAFDPDLAVGTVAMWAERPWPSSPMVWSAIPIRELEINLGPYGEIDDRFVVRYTRNCYLKTLLGEEIYAKIPNEEKSKHTDKPADKSEIRWGFWRLWDRHDDECWQHVVYIGKKLIHDVVIKGAGCCPLIVMRWAPNPDWPWGHGPLLKGLPTLRQIDEFELMRVEHADLAARPPITYPNDSFAAIEQGLEPGMAYPIRVGDHEAVKPIYIPQPFDAANYAYEQKELRLRRMFYVDFPQQTGDTPPTLGQWLDEMARAQRRIGRPGLPFWREGPAQIFLRAMYLEEASGYIEKITVDHKNVTLMPYNPTQRAAEQQDIAMLVHALQIAAQFFPEEFKVQIDGKETMDRMFEKMRIQAMIKFRDEAHIAQAVDQISKLAGGTPPGAQGAGQIPGQQAGAGGPSQ